MIPALTPPPLQILWYHGPTALETGGVVDASPFVEEPMKAPRTLALFSLGLAGLTFTGCNRHHATTREGRLRSVEPRLTDGAAYASCRSDSAAKDLIPDAVCGPPRHRAKQGSAAETARRPALRGGEVSAEPDAGRAALGDLLGQEGTREPDRAVRKLEKEVAASPHDARAWSDLAAAYLVRAQRTDDPRDLLRALEAANRATHEDGHLPEARFNRALALERLFLNPQAMAAWQDYLNLDGKSRWANEARQRQARLGQPSPRSTWEAQKQQLERAALGGDVKEVETIVGSYRQAARELAEQELFGDWADAAVEGQEDRAAERLRILRALGDALARLNGERLVYDSVAAIDAAAGDPRRLSALARATRDFRDGSRDFNARQCEAAVPKLTAARDALVRAGSPLAFRAEDLLVSCDYVNHRYRTGLAAVERLVHGTEGLPYPGVRGHVFWVKALLEVTLGRMKPAVEDYGRARAEYQRLGEEENAVAMAGLLGENLLLLGRTQEAWKSIYQALRATPSLREPRALSRIFMIAGDAALREGADTAALAFEQEWARYSRVSSPQEAVEALTWLARIQDHAGDRESALATLREAETQIAGLGHDQRQRKTADLAMVQGTIQVQEEPREAIDPLTSALAVYEKEGNLIFSLQTVLARGRAYRKAGDDRRAEWDFEAALELYDRMGKQLDQEQEDLRLTLLEESEEVFDELISLQAGHDPDRAFAYADRARTRVLPGSASTLWAGSSSERGRLLAAEPRPLPLAEILHRVPDQVTLVQFVVLEDRVLIWCLRRNGRSADLVQRSVQRGDLETLVARLQKFDSPVWGDTAAGLFDLLVRPWLGAVPPGDRIVFITDKVLHRVPFAALKDRSTGRFLIESHPLAFAPSATLYANALERESSQRGTFRSPGLVVGEPAIDYSRFFLPSLPEAAAEARRLASQTGSPLLLGKDAFKSAFLARAREADWIHFSGHTVVDPQNTLLSVLVLAPGPDGDSGALTAREIYGLHLGGTRLVVLAACETGNQYVPGSEGVTSLARAFLAAGVPTVVASLWSVDDRTTAELLDAFHRRLWDGADSVDALREAQLGMLRGGDAAGRSPRAWAAFEVIGASARNGF
jgi:tetratricopeptide (TPR) repeat protein